MNVDNQDEKINIGGSDLWWDREVYIAPRHARAIQRRLRTILASEGMIAKEAGDAPVVEFNFHRMDDGTYQLGWRLKREPAPAKEAAPPA